MRGAIMMGLGMGGRVQTPLKWHLEYRRQYLNGCGGVAEGRGHHDGASKMAFRIQATVP